mmetsp:Transcript_52041/g.103369  ORF Transcript_52041/g.103369 Transcript_52041/m.103369 type:complete len:226 (+) Transcript_52041:375-1052(+)
MVKESRFELRVSAIPDFQLLDETVPNSFNAVDRARDLAAHSSGRVCISKQIHTTLNRCIEALGVVHTPECHREPVATKGPKVAWQHWIAVVVLPATGDRSMDLQGGALPVPTSLGGLVLFAGAKESQQINQRLRHASLFMCAEFLFFFRAAFFELPQTAKPLFQNPFVLKRSRFEEGCRRRHWAAFRSISHAKAFKQRTRSSTQARGGGGLRRPRRVDGSHEEVR